MNSSLACYQSPIGQLMISGSENGISSILFGEQPFRPSSQLLPLCLQEAVEQLHEYFCHQREEFSLSLDLEQGTPFQQKVWKSLAGIPWGETRNYAQIAREIEQPLSVRAVGSANGQNPFLIVLPCHRVIGSSGLYRLFRWLITQTMAPPP
ncbi:methylated-DNA--[protein]-cysteine S-methyltransferase [Nafulsella turpanensis]|uniref:methylated-DNA--[protein]-cysteine S-methyltransferase n=1 Tax=Nafulsella turpanensis TaxID=1265690 RepID=UPI0003491C4B|nr:methylated-DNA--[protein]-cysteine S-methyltransferase [Nafulsella turpanensis]